MSLSKLQWWTKEPGVLPSMGARRVKQDLATEQLSATFEYVIRCY